MFYGRLGLKFLGPLLLGGAAYGCQGSQEHVGTEVGTLAATKVDTGERVGFLLIPGRHSYILELEGATRPRFVAEVSLSGKGNALPGFLATDLARTGENYYFIRSEEISRSDLGSSAHLRSLLVDVSRLEENADATIIARGALVSIIRTVRSLGSDAGRCPGLLFGDEERLFLLDGSPWTLREVRITAGVRSKAEAQAIRNGVCFEPRSPSGSNPSPLAQEGYLNLGPVHPRIRWSEVETVYTSRVSSI